MGSQVVDKKSSLYLARIVKLIVRELINNNKYSARQNLGHWNSIVDKLIQSNKNWHTIFENIFLKLLRDDFIKIY